MSSISPLSIINLFGQMGSNLGDGISQGYDAYRQQAKRTADATQQYGAMALRNGDIKTAADAANQYGPLYNAAFGTHFDTTPIVGAPMQVSPLAGMDPSTLPASSDIGNLGPGGYQTPLSSYSPDQTGSLSAQLGPVNNDSTPTPFTVPNFDNPQTKKAIASRLQITPQYFDLHPDEERYAVDAFGNVTDVAGNAKSFRPYNRYMPSANGILDTDSGKIVPGTVPPSVPNKSDWTPMPITNPDGTTGYALMDKTTGAIQKTSLQGKAPTGSTKPPTKWYGFDRLQKSGLEPMIEQAASENGVDPALLKGLVFQESGFNPKVVSPAGAVGLGQLMPATATDLGVADSTDPMQNLRGSAKYLKQQLDATGGNVTEALARYNAGPAWRQKYNNQMPAETQKYIQSVPKLASYFSNAPAAAALKAIKPFNEGAFAKSWAVSHGYPAGAPLGGDYLTQYNADLSKAKAQWNQQQGGGSTTGAIDTLLNMK